MTIPAADKLHLSEDGAGVRIPLEQNRNDKGSLFAGSIFAGAILAGYRAAERCFAERGIGGELVAKTASISYIKRIVSDGRAEAVFCSEPLRKPNGNHTLTVTVSVADAERVRGADVTAEFVLLKEKK